jgi:protein-L-isoaspartate(D-aspartate) O-methyltransferase
VTSGCAAAALLLVWPLAAQDRLTERKMMVREQLERRGIRNSAVLEAVRAVPRHLFVPGNLQDVAYEDTPLPIGFGQTISQPYIVGAMTEMLEVNRTHRVLEIGTGSGYQAAILARLAGQVYTIEIVPELAQASRALLEKQGYRNIVVREGDGYKGWPEQAPFDRIMLTAAPPEIPEALVAQLRAGGRLVAPVGRGNQELIILTKDAQGRVRRETSFAVRFVPMVPGKN